MLGLQSDFDYRIIINSEERIKVLFLLIGGERRAKER